MKAQKRTIFLRYTVCFLLAGGAAMAILFIKGISGKPTKEILQTLHDAFFATGAFCLLFAGLLFTENKGAFLGIGYALSRASKSLFPFLPRERETYAQYREKKTKNQRPSHKSVLFWTGIVFTILSIFFLGAWYRI